MRVMFFLALILMTGCQQLKQQVFAPVPFGLYSGMTDGAPKGTPQFRSGWKDGCHSGIAAYGSLHHKATYGYTYDASQLDTSEYHAAWRLGFRHCRWYTAEWIRK